MIRPAVFLDRDGTLNEDHGYINHPSRIRLLPKVIPALKLLRRSGYRLVIASNQSGIARGFFAPETLVRINARLIRLLRERGVRIDGFYNCPHSPDGKVKKFAVDCRCRKPFPGMALKAARDLELDLTRSVMVGDKTSDVKFGHAFGGRSVFILTGYGLGEWEYNRKKVLASAPDFVASDLLAAARWIAGNPG